MKEIRKVRQSAVLTGIDTAAFFQLSITTRDVAADYLTASKLTFTIRSRTFDRLYQQREKSTREALL